MLDVKTLVPNSNYQLHYWKKWERLGDWEIGRRGEAHCFHPFSGSPCLPILKQNVQKGDCQSQRPTSSFFY